MSEVIFDQQEPLTLLPCQEVGIEEVICGQPGCHHLSKRLETPETNLAAPSSF